MGKPDAEPAHKLAADCCVGLSALPAATTNVQNGVCAIVFCGHWDSDDLAFYNDTLHVYRTLNSYLGIPRNNIQVLHSMGVLPKSVSSHPFKTLKEGSKVNLKTAIDEFEKRGDCDTVWIFLAGHRGLKGSIKCVKNRSAEKQTDKKRLAELLSFQTCVHESAPLGKAASQWKAAPSLAALKDYQLLPDEFAGFLSDKMKTHLSVHCCGAGLFRVAFNHPFVESFTSASGPTQFRFECSNKLHWKSSLVWSHKLAESFSASSDVNHSLLLAYQAIVPCDSGASPEFLIRS